MDAIDPVVYSTQYVDCCYQAGRRNTSKLGNFKPGASQGHELDFLKLFLCKCLYMCMFACVRLCVSTPKAINYYWHDMDPYDWLNKSYSYYMTTVVFIVNGYGLGIDMFHGN